MLSQPSSCALWNVTQSLCVLIGGRPPASLTGRLLVSRHCHAVFAPEPPHRRWTCSSPVSLSITSARQPPLNHYHPELHLEWRFFFCVWWRHPSDSHLHVGVIINGLHRFQECSACSLLPCVHSKHQFNVLQKMALHIFINIMCVFHGHSLTLLDLTKAGTVNLLALRTFLRVK